MEFKYTYPVEYVNAIINLLEQNREMTSKKLYNEWIKILRDTTIESVKHRKREHSKPTQYTPSLTTFSEILKNMVDDSYVRKKKDEKSKRTLKETYYQLTDDAKVLLQLNILKMDDRQSTFKRIYEEFFAMRDFFESVYQKALLGDPYDEIDEKISLSEQAVKQIAFISEFGFENFLKKIGIEKKKLEWGKVTYGQMSPLISEILYPFNSNMDLTALKKRYWKENPSVKVKENLMFICYPIRESLDDLEFWIRRIEKLEIVKKHVFDIIPKVISKQFIFFIPGVTDVDILSNNDSLLGISEIHEGINILEKVGLIKTKLFGNEIRYVIADNQLQDFISSIKSAFIAEFMYLLAKWEWFEVPTTQEQKRMGSIFGEKQFSKLSTALEIKLHEHKKRMRKCKNVDEYQELLNENSTYFERLSSDITLDLYKQHRQQMPNTTKEHLQDVKNYWHYRRDKLQKHIDDIIMTYDEEGIEELKMNFDLIIHKYSFLKEILGKICPKAFEPPNIDLQEAITNRENSRQLGFEKLARQLNAITPSSLEKDRRIIKHVEYSQGKNGKVQPILNLDRMSDEQVTKDEDVS
jgi:DNA-binding PadR family transcriptional regulator